MRSTLRFMLALLAMAGACSSDSDAPVEVGDEARQQAVTAALDGQVVVVRNDADFDVRVAVLETEYVTNALALWCFGSDECGTLVVAHGTLRVPLTEITGYAPGREELLVHWWNPADPERQDGEAAPVRKFPLRIGS